MSRQLFVMLTFLLVVVGCKANKDSLDDFYVEAKLQGTRDVEVLAGVLPFDVDSYNRVDERSPFFLPKLPEKVSQPIAKKSCWQPTYRKKNGSLERYSLRRLRLKGVMGSENDITALIQTPKGGVIKIRKGQFMGMNNGQVVDIQSKHITLKETLSDGMGCWQKRYIKLALNH